MSEPACAALWREADWGKSRCAALSSLPNREQVPSTGCKLPIIILSRQQVTVDISGQRERLMTEPDLRFLEAQSLSAVVAAMEHQARREMSQLVQAKVFGLPSLVHNAGRDLRPLKKTHDAAVIGGPICLRSEDQFSRRLNFEIAKDLI